MAELSVADYEAALDDITRRGVDAILHTDHTHVRQSVQRPIARSRQREQRPMQRLETLPHGGIGAIVQSIQARPYATLAIAGLIGFACAALRR